MVILGTLLLIIGFYAITFPAGGAVTLIYFFAFGLMLAGIDLTVRAGAGLPGPDAPDWERYLSIAAGIFALLIGFVALLYPIGAALLVILISLGLLVPGLELMHPGLSGGNRRSPETFFYRVIPGVIHREGAYHPHRRAASYREKGEKLKIQPFLCKTWTRGALMRMVPVPSFLDHFKGDPGGLPHP